MLSSPNLVDFLWPVSTYDRHMVSNVNSDVANVDLAL